MPTIYYRTKDCRADYGFSFEQLSNGEWRAYIVSMPSYGSLNTDGHITHRYSDGDRKYVCWDTPLYSENDVRKIAAAWADLTQFYIRTGVTINQQIGK